MALGDADNGRLRQRIRRDHTPRASAGTTSDGDMDLERVLISMSGPDAPGLIPAITAELARHDALVEDLVHSVIHDRATLGIIVALPVGDAQAPVLKDVLFSAHALDLSVRFGPVDAPRWARWRERQAQTRWIVTLLARRLEAQHLARVTEVVDRAALRIDGVRRLSAGIAAATAPTRASLEISLRGTPTNERAIRSEFLELAQRFGIDIAFQRDDVYRRNRRLVAFDMDSTLIETEVIDELARRCGVGERVAAITERAMRGEIDFTESFRARVGLLKGLPEEALEAIADALPLTEGAERLLAQLQRLGYRTAILSGGFRFFAERVATRLGIDIVHANELEVVDGAVTGRVTGTVVDGARKAELLAQIAQDERITLDQVIAVGDGANDLPMLSLAGLGIAFRAKPLVRESAEQSISELGLDGILYLLGFTDEDQGGGG